jgi:putative restriction endonuclease
MSDTSSARLASEALVDNLLYTRNELKKLFNITDSSISNEVFRPSGYNSLWLFITTNPTGETQHQSVPADENLLIWSGQLTGNTDKLIATHELHGLELLVFYREAPSQYPGGGFIYKGRFEYQKHTVTRPALFTLARSGSMPSLAEIQAEQDKHVAFNPDTVRDGREWVLASIVRRRGQASFRSSLLEAYAGTCPITGCQVEQLLEAAHIIPYLGPSTNHIQNGLPLRADIHTLFDLQLIAICPTSLIVELSPTLKASEYASLAGHPILLPANPTHHPSRDALRAHRIRCPF